MTQMTFPQFVGIEYTSIQDGYAEIRLAIRPEHCNTVGNVHGGVLVTLMDMACGLSGLGARPSPARSATTLTLNASFIAPALGPVLTATGRRTGGGKSVFFVSTDIVNSSGDVVASGQGVYRYLTRPVPTAGQATGNST